MTAFDRSRWGEREARHLLARAAFGAGREQVAEAARAGLEAAVGLLVEGGADDDLFPLPAELADREGYAALVLEVARHRNDPGKREAAERRVRIADREALFALRAWWLRRLRYSPWPLRETMALFWHGHFASSIRKVRSALLLFDQNETFRQLGLGDIRELASRIALDPAMMRYLDVAGSSAASPNENFARELFELFLLGEGNYSEEDIREAARAFTGYRIDPRTLTPVHLPRRADRSSKTLFGRTAAYDAEGVVRLAMEQPACAPFLAAKIWEFYAGVPAGPALREALEGELRASGFVAARLLERIFSSAEFYSEAVMGVQVKSPVQWLIGSAKALAAPVSGSRREQAVLGELGQELFAPPNVKGWEGGRSWISASTMVVRCNRIRELVIERANLASAVPPEKRHPPALLLDTVCSSLLAAEIPGPEREKLAALAASFGPRPSDAQVAELVTLVMQLPEYQLT